MIKRSITALSKEWTEKADRLGLLDQKHFRQAVEAYDFQVLLCKKLRKTIKEEGTFIIVPAGKDAVKRASNPAIADLNKGEILAQKIRIELDGKMKAAEEAEERKRKEAEEEEDEL